MNWASVLRGKYFPHVLLSSDGAYMHVCKCVEVLKAAQAGIVDQHVIVKINT